MTNEERLKRNARGRAYYAKNKEKQRAYLYKKNKERIENNREAYNAYMREYRKKNKEKLSIKKKEYNKKYKKTVENSLANRV